ncbi:PHAF1 family protein [Abortiporus biennis]
MFTLDVEIKPGFGLGIFELGVSLCSTQIPQLLLYYFIYKTARPTSTRVSRAFGPTYPGYDLRYPGAWFSFDDDGRTEGLRGSSQRSDDRTQEVKRVVVTQRLDNNELEDPLSEVKPCRVMMADIEKCIIKVKQGVDLYFFGASSKALRIRIGVTTAQDLLCDLGQPKQVFYKQDDRMHIHSKDSQANAEIGKAYFYNYFQYGIDFLISGSTSRVKKIIIHTNIPGTPMFQRYKRCPWAIEGQPEDDEDDTPPRKWFYDRYEDISHFIKPGENPPSMHLDRTEDQEKLTLPNPTTRLLGFDGIILEVTESAQVMCVMLF